MYLIKKKHFLHIKHLTRHLNFFKVVYIFKKIIFLPSTIKSFWDYIKENLIDIYFYWCMLFVPRLCN